MSEYRVIEGDCLDVLATLDAGRVQTCITSPPYWGLRDYGTEGQLGLEPTPEQYVANLVAVFREVRRVLRDDGTLWLNLGDSYASSGSADASGNARLHEWNGDGAAARNGSRRRRLDGNQDVPKGRAPTVAGLKPKDLVGIPWRVAFALQADGWYLRSDIIWAKPNPMPESVTDRPTKAHEYLFLLSKAQRYYYDADAIREDSDSFGRQESEREHIDGLDRQWQGRPKDRYDIPGRNKRTVWTVATQPFPGAHFATFPPKLIEPCVLAGAPVGGTVLDPFNGAGTTGLVALRHDRDFVGIELNPDYAQMARDRIYDDGPLLNVEAA